MVFSKKKNKKKVMSAVCLEFLKNAFVLSVRPEKKKINWNKMCARCGQLVAPSRNWICRRLLVTCFACWTTGRPVEHVMASRCARRAAVGPSKISVTRKISFYLFARRLRAHVSACYATPGTIAQQRANWLEPLGRRFKTGVTRVVAKQGPPYFQCPTS